MPEFGALSRGSLESLARHDWGWADTECSVCHMGRGCSSYQGKYYCLPIAIKQASASTGNTTPLRITGKPPTPYPLPARKQGTSQVPIAQGTAHPRQVVSL
jgi:hypothetical protein